MIATHSGGPAFNFLLAFRNQLSGLGAIVYPRTISVYKGAKFNIGSVRKILTNFQNFI